MDLRIEFERVDGDRWRAWAPDFGTEAFGADPAAAMRACETETLAVIGERRERGEKIVRR